MSFASFLYLLSFAFLLQTTFGADPLFHFCSTTGNFSTNGPYQSNLDKLISYLSIQAPPSGFGLGSMGQEPKQIAYGLALCRGDVKAPECKTCVVEAGNEIRKRCPYNKGAIIWYDNCLLKYSNKEFFGRIDTRNTFYMWNLNVVEEPETFNQKTQQLLSQLANEAYTNPKLYATGVMELDDDDDDDGDDDDDDDDDDQKLYGLTQCTRDISSNDCKKCLDDIISQLQGCCDGKEGGRVVGGSCNFRYEIYPFVNA